MRTDDRCTQTDELCSWIESIGESRRHLRLSPFLPFRGKSALSPLQPAVPRKARGAMEENPHQFPKPGEARGVEHTAMIDLLTHDRATGQVEIVMFEPRPWDGGEEQLYQLQEKLNAYLSFALDGEMAETYPQLMNLPLRVVLRCIEPPPSEAVEFLAQVREQIALQGIDLEVRYAREPESGASEDGSCGHGCGCHGP